MGNFLKLIFIDLLPAYGCVALIWLIITMQNSSEKRVKDVRRNKAAEAKKYLVKKGKIKFFTYCKNDNYYGIVDNDLWICGNGRLFRIQIENIMKTELKYHVIEKNKMKFMTIMPTFDKHTRLVKFELVIYARVGSDTNLVFTPQIVDLQRIEKLQMLLNEMIEEGKNIGKSE